MRRINYLIVAILVFLLVPAILNLLISKKAFCEIAGDESSWVSFWGSYAGAALTSLISFVILDRTIASNHEENETNRKIIETDRLRHDITSRLTNLDVRKFTNDISYIRSIGFNHKEEMARIDEMYSQIRKDVVSFKILYKAKFDDFIIVYEEACNKYLRILQEIIQLLGDLDEHRRDTEHYRSTLDQVEIKFKDIIKLNDVVVKLWEMAGSLIDSQIKS
jgi:hypothetical protein